jgi:hypothetical protein
MVTLAAAFTVVLGTEPAAARTKDKALHREADRKGNEPFGNVSKGPVQIFVSINQQKLHVYSDGTHVADTSIATGVPQLPTPTGVFSVIQKQVFHRSNIYSGAPMPFMQRITWSGVALHEGENIGHPASHGCIRMPGEFAARLYKFTRLGARVIVAKGELKPVDFADPHLFVHRDIQAAAVPDTGAVKTVQSADTDKASDAGPIAKPFELGLRGTNPNVPGSFVVAASDSQKPIATDAVTTDAPSTDAAKPADVEKPSDTASSSDAAKSSDAGKSSEVAQSSDSAKSSDVKSSDAKPDASAAAGAKAADKAAPASDPKPDASAVTGSTTGVPVIAVPDQPAASPAADTVKPNPIKKTPIAIFISRKERKIFVRQDFEPVFEEAIAIDHPEQPMGTHVFTAMEFLPDNSTFRWNVISMPAESAKPPKQSRIVAEEENRYDRYGRPVRHKRPSESQPAAEQPAPQTPQEVLARIDLPQDAVDFISQRMVPGSSLIVSDHGLGDETGEGTDFIVVTR